ncbi:ABC transporter permease [Ohtaekwangia koreensis]|uniref:MacB-like core domain-containing protein n=1 Tax=Ohtaekwangia koreensis TaxID=688867 RepID=A0A1T5JAV1_9BACT|nr:ABC transporter permease [Ohtaekwangia koreensis]SKC48474.1 MacB-like core domain-containing protein [Ohtaekwangia koreensis]
MIKNYLVLTFRNFLRNKNYTLINILGLTIGITACIIIFLLVTYDLSFDRFHSRYNRIYRVVQDAKNSSGESMNATTPYPFVKAFRNDFSDIPFITQLHYQDEMLLKIGDEKVKVENIVFTDSLFFDVFDFKVLSGNPKQELGQPGKVFLTKSLADKILKGREHLTMKINNMLDVEVVGVIQDPPATSHMNFSMIVSMPSFSKDFLGGMNIDGWEMTAAGFAYLVLPENISEGELDRRFGPFVAKYHSKEDSERKMYGLQPLSNIHFDENYTENPGTVSNASYSDLLIMSILGAFILFIACINFINLATALAIRKSKEIGIRKTLGAKRGQLTVYFLGETFLLTIIAVLISLCITEWLLPWINDFLERQLDLNLLSNPLLLLFLLGLIVFVTFLSGFYPAMILSGYNPAVVLKNKISAQGSSGAGVRKVLVVFQFMIAQVLIIGTLVIAAQMRYFKNKPLGFDKEAVINVPVPDIKKDLMESLRTRLESNRSIENFSFSLGAPTSDNNFGTNYFLSEKGPAEMYDIGVKPVDWHYLDTYGIKLKAGRWFNETDEKLADMTLPEEEQKHVYIINESAMKRLGFNTPEDILGKNITTGVSRIDAEVVGVVEDFHASSLHNTIKPVVFVNFPYFYYDLGIKVNASDFKEAIGFIEKQWSEVFPEYYFEYEFLDEKLAGLYRQDERTFTLFKIFAGISIFIGCLGLYGLISFMANQKLKEVGIRKVLGASIGSIVMLFSKEFIKLIVIAFAVAAPLAWYCMHEWLSGFAYRTPIRWWMFALGLASTLIISLLTVSYRSIRSAVSNPADTLRTE